jgi:predicted acyl esterase
MLKKSASRMLENRALLPSGVEVSTRVSRRQACAPAPQLDVIFISSNVPKGHPGSLTYRSGRGNVFPALCALAVTLLFAAPLATAFSQSSAHETFPATIRMRDGVTLAADVYLPGSGRWPTLLVRTPYNRKTQFAKSYLYFSRHGFAVVLEDVRGRYASRGEFGPVPQEGPDGNDTINWISEQPWSDGRVGMVGSSYLGIVQWWAALQDNPHLLAISPMDSGDDEYLDRFYSPGGTLQLGHRLFWLAENLKPASQMPVPLGSYIWHLPLRTSDLAATGEVLPLWRSSLDHPSYDAFWKAQSLRLRMKQVNAAVLSLGGWFDNYAESDLDAFSRLALQHKPIETWIGPWGHNPATKFATRDFGPEAALPIRMKQAEWFTKSLKRGVSSGLVEPYQPQLHLFVMGPDVWREEREWPLARTHYTPVYLVSDGNANSVQGDGGLRWQPAIKNPSDSFTYDPKNPVPTMGGSICCDPVALPPGPLDQRSVEVRSDVLVYTSDRLTEDLEVTGPLRTILYVSTSVNDTDFTAKLVDVQPDGRPLLVSDGIQRLRYRLSLDKPVLVKRNEAYQISVDTGVTSYVFAPGHRIRVEVSSSNFPRFGRNLNAAGLSADQSKMTKAKQVVYHEKGYPSAIILPVIPREGRSRSVVSRAAF